MPLELIVPLSFVLSLVAYAWIAKWYLMPTLAGLPRPKALVPLLLLHTFRFIGLAFLVPGVTAQPLDPRFANPAAYGDLLASLLAFLAIIALRQRWRAAIALVWIFNVAGTVDLLYALTQGARFNLPGAMGATFFIPAVIVPALLVTHVVIFILLLRREPKL
ncbi:MAG: hypothetical protein ABI423_06350 [Burkholderiales bacterium]